MQGRSLVATSRGHSSSWCAGLSPSWPLLLWSTGSRHAGSVVVAHGPSCSTACGIFPDQGSNPCPLRWQADSQPLHHQGSPGSVILKRNKTKSRLWQLPDFSASPALPTILKISNSLLNPLLIETLREFSISCIEP